LLLTGRNRKFAQGAVECLTESGLSLHNLMATIRHRNEEEFYSYGIWPLLLNKRMSMRDGELSFDEGVDITHPILHVLGE